MRLHPLATAFLAAILLTVPAFSQNQRLFYSLSVEDGMPHSEVNAITCDNDGFLWFGTYNGVARYDGYSLMPMTKDNGKSMRVISLYCDDANSLLYIGTEGDGLKVMDLHKNKIIGRFHFANTINCIVKGQDDGLLLGTDRGLATFVYSDSKYEYEFSDLAFRKVNSILPIDGQTMIVSGDDGAHLVNVALDNMTDIITGYASCAFRYSDEEVLLGVFSGLYKYNLGTGACEKILDKEPRCIFKADDDYWIGIQNNGIIRLDEKLETIHEYSADNGANGLNNNAIKAFYQDFSGNLWVGTQNGASKYYHRAESFEFYSDVLDYDDKGPTGSQNKTSTFYEADEGILWIGKHVSGLKILDRASRTISSVPRACWPEIYGQTISSYYKDGQGRLWVGTWSGLYILTEDQVQALNRLEPVSPFDFAKVNKLTGTTFFKIDGDRSGNIWMSTNKGLIKFTPSSPGSLDGSFSHYLQSKVTTDFHIDYCKDGSESVWLGTEHGFYKLLFSRGQDSPVILDVSESSDGRPLKDEFISVVYCDSRDSLWALSIDGYIIKVLTGREPGEDISFKIQDINVNGMSNTAESLEEDNDGKFWIGGINMVKFDPETWSIDFFDESKGMQNRSFKFWSSARLSTGELVFGGVNGISIFDPGRLVYNSVPPEIVFEDLSILGRKVEVNEVIHRKVLLENVLNHTESIILPHKYNSFAISFAALHYTSPSNNKYLYRLSGHEKQWRSAMGQDHSAVYSNLPSGTYRFQVRGSNCDSIWSDETKELVIRINRPVMGSIPAIAIYILLALASLFFAMKNILKKEEERKVTQMNEMKLKYFTDISHDIKTPLSLIFAPVNELAEDDNLDPSAHKKISLIKKNVSKLTDLVQQILDFNKIESNTMSLKFSEQDMVNVCKSTMSYFEDKAERKDIKFTFASDSPQIPVTIDREKLEKVIFNILGNAFKFTPEKGTIGVKCTVRNSDVVTCISDTGCGIEEKDIGRIFDRFYYGSNSAGGSGIGLALAKAIIEQHGGKIWAESEVGKGSSVFFTIPLSSGAATEEADLSSNDDGINSYAEIRDEEIAEEKLYSGKRMAGRKYEILVVEDNDDLREYLRDSMASHFNTHACSNGMEAYQYVLDNDIDCVITDIMMPVMSGIELCRKIKNDGRTSHIPVILLSAKDGEESKIEGSEAGADEYLTKPFNMNLLVSRTEKIIAQRESLKSVFHKSIDISPSMVTITPLDEQFMQNCIKLIEDNISDASYTVENLCQDLSMSHTVVYKKIKSLTDLSVVAFIRSIRLKRAAQLLAQDGSSIKNVMYMVGFDNNSYFSARFKKEFGCTPAEYVERCKNEKADR